MRRTGVERRLPGGWTAGPEFPNLLLEEGYCQEVSVASPL